LRLLFTSLFCVLLSGCSTFYGSVPDSHKVLFWPQAKRDMGFRAVEDYAKVKTIKAGEKISPLPTGYLIELPIDVDFFHPAFLGPSIELPIDVDAFIERQYIAGLIVMKDGEVLLEKYARGFDQNDRWTSFSVAKSITSTLVGAAIKDGYIKSLDDEITQYIPNLIGSAYDGVTVRQLLTMTSGVKWDESYINPLSDVARFIKQKPEPGVTQTVSYMRKLKREVPAGTKWKYKTGETNLLGVLVSKATGKALSDYLSEKIWQPYGMQADAIWALDLTDHEMGGCCLSARLRDYARYGQFMLDGAKIDGKAIVPDDWVEQATSSQVNFNKLSGYGYQWWTSSNGNYMAQGIFGQLIFISPKQNLVIVMLSNWPKASASEEMLSERYQFMAAVAMAVKKGKDEVGDAEP
jgi:CubicO group peptidase (beta-lactamase class C family)